MHKIIAASQQKDIQQQVAPAKRWRLQFGKDSLLNYSVQYYFIPALYALFFYLLYNGLSPMYLVTFVFFFIPFCDEFFEHDVRNPTRQEERALENDLRFKAPLYVSLFADWVLSFFVIATLLNRDFSLLNQGVILFGAGVFAGSNINVAHELSHKLIDKLDYALGLLTMSKNLYMHWPTEHVQGHHVWVATPHDPATSRKGQNLYAFWVQTIVGTWRSAWRIECERLAKAKHPSPLTFRNRIFYYVLNNLLVPYSVYRYFSAAGGAEATATNILGLFNARGFWGAYYFIVIAAISVLFLETVNYIEHYGLQRKLISAPNTYEKVTNLHSWNAPHRLTNYVLFKLQRHSDHHANALKPYQILLSDENSPAMPNGYALMVIIALFPPVWFDIMDRQLEMFKSGHRNSLTEAYIQQKIRKFLFCLGFALLLLTYLSVKYDFSK